MTTISQTEMARPSWLSRAESWMDSKGKGAWIAATVLGFIFFWPLGLAILAYMIWSKRMFNSCNRRHSRRHGSFMTQSTGNRAFDAYRDETLRRLEEERQSFESFLERLREAKDKAEFDQFMDDRAKAARNEAAGTDGEPA